MARVCATRMSSTSSSRSGRVRPAVRVGSDSPSSRRSSTPISDRSAWPTRPVAARPSRSASPPVATSRTRWRAMDDVHRVLVVDDEPAILRAVSRALAARGYAVRQADTGRKALDLIASEDPHAVLLDLCLPDIDGVQVCREVRAWSTVPIIVLSASWEDHRKVEALDEGANDYVTKPYSTPELLARLRAALRSSGPSRQLVDE